MGKMATDLLFSRSGGVGLLNRREPRQFLLAGGGTGGHIIPALAVARELRSRGHRVFFIGTERGLEAKLVPRECFDLELIRVGGLKRVGLRQTLATLLQLP